MGTLSRTIKQTLFAFLIITRLGTILMKQASVDDKFSRVRATDIVNLPGRLVAIKNIREPNYPRSASNHPQLQKRQA